MERDDGLEYYTTKYGNGYHLVGFTDGKMTHYDGPHDDEQGVAEALALIQRLHFPKKMSPDFWKMVIVKDVPEFQGEMEEETIAALNVMLDSYNAKRGSE